MKKILVLASAVAMAAVSFADLCTPEAGPQVKCPVWYLQVSMKTLVPQAVVVKGQNGTVCAPGSATDLCTALTLGTRNFSGGWWDCKTLCDADSDPKHALKRGDHFILWENTTGIAVTKPLSYDATEGYSADVAPWNILDRFGAKAEYVEGYINIALAGASIPKAYEGYAEYKGAYMGTLTLAGAGIWAENTVKVMQGYAVAAWKPECGACWDLCEAYTSWCDESATGFVAKPGAADVTDANVAGAGTWTLRYYNASDAKVTLGSLVPATAQGKDEDFIQD